MKGKGQDMTYEIIELEEKKVVGVSARTNNTDPNMGKIIGGLWETLFSKNVFEKIENKISEKALGIYTEYEGNEKDNYLVIAGCEVSEIGDYPKGSIVSTIPKGKYAKFIVKGDMHKAVAQFWQELWNMDLPRAFTCDFEEYQDDNMEHTEIHIYISLSE